MMKRKQIFMCCEDTMRMFYSHREIIDEISELNDHSFEEQFFYCRQNTYVTHDEEKTTEQTKGMI